MANTLASRIPPHNDDAERAVIGAMLIDEKAVPLAQQYLREDDFYSPRHRKIFKAIGTLFINGTGADLLTLSSELEKEGKLDEAGGNDYLASLTHAVPSSANTEYYAEVVRNHALRRALIQFAGEIGTKAFDETEEPDTLLETAQEILFRISDPRGINRYKKVNELIVPVFNDLENRYKNRDKEFTGVPSGFHALDKMTSGFQPAELTIIGARPSMGKTALALSMATRIAIKHNTPVAFFSLEMPENALMMRLISAESGVDSQKLRTGTFTHSVLAQEIFPVAERLHLAPLYIGDTPNMTMGSIRTMARMLRVQEKVEIVFIDYIGLITSENNRMRPRWEIFSEISRSLKGLARELNIPVVALSQLSREAEKQKPGMADLRETGSIEQDADMIILIDRDRELEKTTEEQAQATGQKAELILAKNRNGPVGKIELTFLKHLAKYVDFTDDRG